jgi:hypothetical protein
MLTMFREAPATDGTPGPYSWRRVASAILLFSAVGLFTVALLVTRGSIAATVPGWVLMVPGGACLAGAILMPILTTVEGIQELIQAARGKSGAAS